MSQQRLMEWNKFITTEQDSKYYEEKSKDKIQECEEKIVKLDKDIHKLLITKEEIEINFNSENLDLSSIPSTLIIDKTSYYKKRFLHLCTFKTPIFINIFLEF